jgi:hypothetical protein
VPGATDDVCIPSNAVNGGPDARGIPSISVNSIQVGQGSELTFGSGTVSVTTTVTNQEGFLSLLGTTLSATSVNNEEGQLMGSGTIEGSLTNSGNLAPQGSPITVTGDYTQTSTGQLREYWGSGGILNVGGNATLSGFLSIDFDFKMPPKKGATYTAMTFGGSLTGAFTNASPGTAEYQKHSVVERFD